MKRVIGCVAVLGLIGAGALLSRAADGSAAPAPAGQPSPAHVLAAGRDVRVYLRQEAMPGRPIEWRGGAVKQVDDRFVTLSMSGGETLWIPMASVAYIESSKAATAKPN
jgi:hypothetical protein